MSANDDLIEAAAEVRIEEQQQERGVERDEREGRPSASSMERLSLCPGSHALSLGIRDKESAEATRGSRIHALVAGEKVENPTADERSVAATCDELAQNVVESTIGVPIGDCDEVWREHRLWSKDLRFSGKPDLVAVHGADAVIIDYKTGGGAVTEAAGNVQLRALAVLVQQNVARSLDSITVAIIQPLASQRISVCKYTKADMIMAANEVYVIIAASERVEAARFSGAKQCKYCPARTRCPEANESVKALSTTLSSTAVTQLTAEKLAAALDVCEQAEAVIEAIREEAKQRIAFGEPLHGWALRPGVEREMVKNTPEVFSRYMFAGGTQERFLEAASVSKSSIKEALKAVTGFKGKQLDEQVRLILDGCTEKTAPGVKLVREKAVKE